MPKRVAETPGNVQISETIGSGPFVFRKDLWRPGERTVYDKFKDYKPRAEPPSGLSGGKVVHVDRVEWHNITDPQTVINALANGEIDMVDQPVIELLSLLEGDKNIKIADLNPLGAQIDFRFNTLHKPFDNPKIRQAVFYALNQKDFLVAGYTDARSSSRSARRSSSAARRSPPTRASRTSSRPTSPSRSRSSRKKAMTARRSCCSMPPIPTPDG